METANKVRVGLVSMPWMAPGIPSIQLATLAAALQQEGIESESHELFLDYAACIGVHLYDILSNGRGFTEEWLFAQHYFGPETGNDLTEFRAHRPPIGLKSAELEERVLDALIPVTDDFLDRIAKEIDWAQYDLIGFSLTISQTAASMALTRLIKQRYPHITIIYGGAACAGPMGPALLRVCPYVDVVVGGEGELVLPELVRRLRRTAPLHGLPSVSWRAATGDIVRNPGGSLYDRRGNRLRIQFDSYFERLASVGLRDQVVPWLPFESSRGCWYGEKIQCTFCGLHEIMQYRYWEWESVLEQLEDWERRYGIRQFFSVDLIIPREYLHTFLPEVARRGHIWSIFYEVKANLKRSEVEVLAAGGVHWIQPGIESLDGEVLRLMRKGVTPLQNIQLLKWCEELGMRVTWNVIVGIPGEDPAAYPAMAERMRMLVHLPPPSGASPFQLHRFSPYFEQPDEFGIEALGAHPLYKYIFPVAQEDLDELVYCYDYNLQQPLSLSTDALPVGEAIEEWRTARARGATLRFCVRPDGSAEILDTRTLPDKTHRLSRSEALLYVFLDEAKTEDRLESTFLQAHPVEADDLARQGGIAAVLDSWTKLGLVIRDSRRVLAIAVNESRVAEKRRHQPSGLHAPVAYLSDITSGV